MASKVDGNEPKLTKTGADGRKDERKGVSPGNEVADQGDLANAQGANSEGKADGSGESHGKAHRNAQGGQWGKNRGRGGNAAHNKR